MDDWSLDGQFELEADHLAESVVRRGLFYSQEDMKAIVDALPDEAVSDKARFDCWIERLVFAAIAYAGMAAMEERLSNNTGRRAQLRDLTRTAASMQQQIRTLDPVARGPLAEALDIDALYQMLGLVVDCTRSEAQAGVGKPRRGRRIPASRKVFMTALSALWEEVTGHPAGYTYDAYGDRYGGPFLRFAEAAAKPVMGADFSIRDFAEWVKRGRSARR